MGQDDGRVGVSETDLFDFEAPAIPEGRAPTTEAGRLAWLRLARSRGVGPVAFQRIMRRVGSAEEALERLPDLARRAGVEAASAVEAEAEMARGEAAGARLLCLGAPDYPRMLARIDAPPPALWLLGRPETLAEKAVAVVGSRNASALGRRFAEETAKALAEAGWLVVSGLARGIDAAAHKGALDAVDGLTAAALAGGVDHVYPPENAALHARIAETGALVSEMPMGMEPAARHFPRRNRIVSGLSKGVLVIEGALRSGALITARAALDQGREAMAAPGHPWDARAAGSNLLIRDGAALIRSAEDVVEALETGGFARRRRPGPPPEAEDEAFEEEALEDETLESRTEEAATDDGAPHAPAERLLALLSLSPIQLDELTRQSGLAPAEIAQALMTLELSGRIERRPGGMICLAAPA